MSRPDVKTGASVTGCLLAPNKQYWRIVSSFWTHAGILHVLGNVGCLMAFGWRLECTFGALPIAAIYLASGFSGALSSAVFLPESVCVGSSGAILGLFGAQWAELLMNYWSDRQERYTRLRLLQFATLAIILTSLEPFTNFFCHISGLVCGGLLGLALLVRKRYGRDGQAPFPKNFEPPRSAR